MAITTTANFAHPKHRGFRIPNHYSVIDNAELATLSVTETIVVHNARELETAPTLGTHGFQLVHAPTNCDLFNTDEVSTTFYDECRLMLQNVTGCHEVRGGGHEYRNGFGGEKGERGVKPTPNGSGGAYAMGIHSDMCAAVEHGFSRIVPDARHFQSINIWRSADRVRIQMMPLAVCDIGSISPDDIVFGDGTNTGNIRQYTKVIDQRIIHSPTQRWYYYPDLEPDEVLIFRQYDTRQESLARRTVFHQAVVDPTSSEDAPMRSTIEVRMQAVFEIETEKEERKARFVGEISDHYADGRKCDWWEGPIENYVPPDGV